MLLFLLGSLNVWGVDTWELSDIDDLTSSDVFVIAYLKSSVYYAMGNDNGTTSAPSATSITVTKNAITSNVSDAMQWNISGNSTDGYVFYPNGSTTTWLYCTAANNGTRVGTNANKLFTLGVDNGETYLYLKNTATSRYVGQYNNADFRCYTAAANHQNIGSQHVYFFKKVTSGSTNPTGFFNQVCFLSSYISQLMVISKASRRQVEGNSYPTTPYIYINIYPVKLNSLNS